MIPCNYHTHTTYCDGRNTVREMVEAAIALGCPELGFSGHSYLSFDRSWVMSPEGTALYCRDVRQAAEEYRDRIRIYLGLEQDSFSAPPTEDFDYIIGSVHCIPCGGEMLSVDESEETQRAEVERYFGGDYYAFCEAYYAELTHVYEKTHCDIIGHFDLVTKFNEGCRLFDTQHPRYRKAAQAALDELIKTPAIFEINTGAIARGYRTVPYPEQPWLQQLRDAGKRLLWNSDCHQASQLLCGMPQQDNRLFI